ncbi:MAG: DUF1015 family protein [Clostridia bacterium]|nr:DUF1015 family protein [Clostridia bacterium]
MSVFNPADILIPKKIDGKWPVIACDQFTSSPEYWEETERIVGDSPSSLRLVLPEIYLGEQDRIGLIHDKMGEYLRGGLFTEYRDALVLVERSLPSGRVRRGIVGKADLNEYPDGMLRATEATVPERLPPRIRIRDGAALELPHALLFINSATAVPACSRGTVIYDLELMQGGGHVRGTLMTDDEKKAFYSELNGAEGSAMFAVGDGNHSLAAAKASGSRYALCEAVSVYDGAIVFEPIYRVIKNAAPDAVMSLAAQMPAGGKNKIRVFSGETESCFYTDGLPVSAVDVFIGMCRRYMPDISVDYIHGLEDLADLSREPGNVCFSFDGISRDELFPYIEKNGILPKKAFSMGTAREKRYYIEAMKI